MYNSAYPMTVLIPVALQLLLLKDKMAVPRDGFHHAMHESHVLKTPTLNHPARGISVIVNKLDPSRNG